MYQNWSLPTQTKLNIKYIWQLKSQNLNLTGNELITSIWSLLSSMACVKCLTNTFNLSSCLKASKTILFILITFSSLFDGLGITPIRDSESVFWKKKNAHT